MGRGVSGPRKCGSSPEVLIELAGRQRAGSRAPPAARARGGSLRLVMSPVVALVSFRNTCETSHL